MKLTSGVLELRKRVCRLLHRAVAVVAVIVYHMEHAWLPGGFTGVDVFFVISGFVVSGSLLRECATMPATHVIFEFYS